MTKILYLSTIFLYLFISSVTPVAAFESGAKTTVQATIPAKTDIRLFGYTAPNSIVQAQGIRTFAQTLSDKTGYFIIAHLPVSYEAKEICLTTIDNQRRTGFPICYPIPDYDKPTEIGPILLSPTLSLSKASLLQQETGQASGMTIPESQVVISFFEIPAGNIAKKLGSEIAKTFNPVAEAADLPQVSGFSDKKGNFSVNLPTQKAINFRVFAKAYYKKLPTPKSSTLSFQIQSLTRVWITDIVPKLLFFILLLIATGILIGKEKKEKRAWRWLSAFTEKQMGPFAVRSRLRLRRIRYNLREYWRSNRM